MLFFRIMHFLVPILLVWLIVKMLRSGKSSARPRVRTGRAGRKYVESKVLPDDETD